MKADADIRRDVQTELQWDPRLDDHGIGVVVNNGIVTLTGQVSRFSDRWTAEDIVKRIGGVRAIANDIQVNIPKAGERSDTEIADAAATAISWHTATAATPIKPIVKDGWVTLAGEADWGYQKHSAEAAVRNLTGVKGVMNSIVIRPSAKTSEVKLKIEEAFERHAMLDAKDIKVNVNGSRVTLEGKVHSWQEHDDAANAAWAAPGVATVENHLLIQI
jgi:osmotically-inducible protein OsmY